MSLVRHRSLYRTNTSGYRGVSFDHDLGKWRSSIIVRCRKIHIGCYSSSRDAAIAYDALAKYLHGRNACTNASLGLL